VKDFEVINPIITGKQELSYRTGQGKYYHFNVRGDTFALDVNSLMLIRGLKENLPPPSDEVSQFPFCPNRNVLALLFCLTHQCNLKCKYCYVDRLYSSNDRMTPEIAATALTTLVNPDAVRKQGLRISFFGGEALLEFELLKQIVSLVRTAFPSPCPVQFSLTTNGTLLTKPIAKFLVEHSFSVILSLDGPRELHNETRISRGGAGSFDVALEGLTLLNEVALKKITLRATFFPENPRIMERLVFLNALCDQGLAANVSIEPSILTESECAAQEIDQFQDKINAARLEAEYAEATDWLLGRLRQKKPARFHNIMLYAERLLYRRKYCSDCGAGVGYISIGPTGKIFACHRETNSLIGDLSQGGIDEALRAQWVDNRYYVNKECRRCDLRNVCGGTCREHSLGSMGDIFDVDPVRCTFKRLWIHSAVYLISELPSADRTSLILQKKPQKVELPDSKKERFNLVREAGGFGDIISIGGAAVQIKKEFPNSEICLYLPDDFVDVAKHLREIDQVVGLGSVETLSKQRRVRGEKFDSGKYTYLSKVANRGLVVDLWCPAVKYEQQEKDRIQHTRSQIFASVICKEDSHAIPRWFSTPAERVKASSYLNKAFGDPSDTGPTIALAARGTKAEKNISEHHLQDLLTWLISKNSNVVWMDCLDPSVILHGFANNKIVWPNVSFCESVAILEQCDLLISVDTGIFHAGVAARVPTVGVFGMTDGNPYIGFYPLTYVVQNEVPHEGICTIPCNSSSEKGHIVGCSLACARMQNLSFDELKLAVLSAMKTASAPQFQEYRLRLFDEK
jgi:uncharacterized protein